MCSQVGVSGWQNIMESLTGSTKYRKMINAICDPQDIFARLNDEWVRTAVVAALVAAMANDPFCTPDFAANTNTTNWSWRHADESKFLHGGIFYTSTLCTILTVILSTVFIISFNSVPDNRARFYVHKLAPFLGVPGCMLNLGIFGIFVGNVLMAIMRYNAYPSVPYVAGGVAMAVLVLSFAIQVWVTRRLIPRVNSLILPAEELAPMFEETIEHFSTYRESSGNALGSWLKELGSSEAEAAQVISP